MKIGRKEYDINDKDVIFDNGACYQLISREIRSGFNTASPIISKALFAKLLKNDVVKIHKNSEEICKRRYGYTDCRLWVFDIEKLKNLDL